MSLVDIFFWPWLVLMFWRFFALWNGLITKKEYYSIACLCSTISMLIAFTTIFNGGVGWLIFGIIFTPLNAKDAWFYYKKWRDEDDDEDFRHRRRERIANKIPRPTIVKLRPIETGV